MFSIPMLLGYGKDLLAGYNTATEEQRSLYNEKRVLRTAGLTLLTVGLLLVIFTYLYDVELLSLSYLLVVPFLPLLVGIPLMNSSFCKKKN